MNALAKASLGLLTAAILFAVPALTLAAAQSPPTTATSPTAAPAASPMQFGMDSGAIAAETAAGARPDYGTFWIGPWTLTSGWGGPDGQLDAMRNAGVTPAIHFYYWGDDISQSCLENGCWSNLHNTQKDKAHWQMLADQLVSHLNSKMQGKPVLIFLETEFNKGNVATYEPLDGYLADKATQIHSGYPAAKVVMSLGNWNSPAWTTWDRTAAASDYVGIQGMRGSTRQSATDYATLYEGVLSGAKTLKADFGKPIVLQDIALSTYPEPDYLARQADELHQFFTGMGDLQAQGVQALLYRSWKDSPNMDTANYYGEAERHWGLAWAGNGTEKTGGQVWTDGVKAVRAAPAPAPSPSASPTPSSSPTSSASPTRSSTPTPSASPSPSPAPSSSSASSTSPKPYAATFTTRSASNTDWVQEGVSAATVPAKVDVQVGGGAWQSLKLQSYGDWTLGTHIAKGTTVAFRATAPDGSVATSAPQPWLGAAASSTSASASPTKAPTATATASATPSATPSVAPAGPFTAKFTPKTVGDDWWVETAVASSQAPAKVEAKVGSGAAWAPMTKQSTGTYAMSAHAPDGTYVQFRATGPTGTVVLSATYIWG